MNNILTVFKKEFYRVISDKRLIFTAIFLPGLAIYMMYSFMGNALVGEITDIEDHKMIIYTENMPAEFVQYISLNTTEDPEFYDLADSTYAEVELLILEGEVDLLIKFPENLMDLLSNYEDPNFELPDIMTFFNPGEKYSEASYYKMRGILNGFSSKEGFDRYGDAFFIFSLDADNPDQIIQNNDKAAGQGFAMLLPMLIVMFLFSGAMSIGPDSIAGEKERGTIATLLITPIKRSEIAIGKVLSLTVISLFSATSSFIGIMASLPKLMAGDESISADIYGINDYIMLFSIILATVLVIVGLISVLSAYAKSIKEASMLILPFYFISIVVGISTMFSGEATGEMLAYLIPIYNSVNMIIAILTFEVIPMHYMLTIVSSVVYLSILIFILNKLFQSEKIMFSK